MRVWGITDVGLVRKGLFPGVRHYEFCALFHSALHEIRRDRMRLRHVCSDEKEEFGVFKFAERVGHCA